jgi:predicted DNA-binding transcriptional regulator AlpA
MSRQIKSEVTQVIPETVKHFHQLSPECQVRLPVVKIMLGVSGATVWRLVKAKKLTAYKLTERTTSFNVAQLRSLLAAKVEA